MKQSNQINTLPEGKKIAYVQADWHKDIVEQSLFAFTKYLAKRGIDDAKLDVFNVPGSLEIPLQCKLLAQTENYAIIIAAGLIVDGGIYRHDFVASSVLDSMMNIQLESEVPIISVVLTPHHFCSEEHQKFFFEHFKLKGKEAAKACLQTIKNINMLEPPI